jgi:hypothetical protein
MELIVSLPEEMLEELRLAARERGCPPHQFAIETLESVLASRRLPRAYVSPRTKGPRMTGQRGTEETELLAHKIVTPIHA